MNYEILEDWVDETRNLDMNHRGQFNRGKELMIRLGTFVHAFSKISLPSAPITRDKNRKALLYQTTSIPETALSYLRGDKALPTNIMGWPTLLSLLMALYAMAEVATPLLEAIVADCKRINADLLTQLETHVDRMDMLDAEADAAEEVKSDAAPPAKRLKREVKPRDISNEARWVLRLKLCRDKVLFDCLAKTFKEVDDVLKGVTRQDELFQKAFASIPIACECRRPVGLDLDDEFDDLSK